jgi:hypothetical protein
MTKRKINIWWGICWGLVSGPLFSGCVGFNSSESAEEKSEFLTTKDYSVDKSWNPILIHNHQFFYSLLPGWGASVSSGGKKIDLSHLNLRDSDMIKKSGVVLHSPSWAFPSPSKDPQNLKGIIPNIKDICIREVKILDDKNANISKNAVIYGESSGGGFKNLEALTDGDLENACSSNYPVIDKAQTGFISFTFLEKHKIKSIEIHHGRKNGCAMVSIPKDFNIQYHNGSGWANFPDAETKNNKSETTTHELPEISTSAIRISVNEQSDLYDYRCFPFSVDNKLLNRNILERSVPPDAPFYWWYIGHTSEIFFGFPKNPDVDMEGYRKWKEAHPFFFGFGLLEWDNDILKAFLPMAKAFDKKYGFVIEENGRPLTKGYINACKTRIVERDFPSDYAKDKEQMVQWMEKEFKFQNKVLFNDAFMMLGHTTWFHYTLEWGSKLFLMESTGGTPNRQIQYAFARGISREYEKPWGVYFAYFLGGGYLDYINPPKKVNENYARGPHCGISSSSHRRQLYLAYLSGAAFFDFEHPDIVPFSESGKEGEYELSPHGKAIKEVFDFSQKHPDRGSVYSPVGLLMDYAHGWTFWGDDCKVFMGMFPMTDGDLMLDRFLYEIFPWERKRFEEGNGYCMTNTPYGDIFDVVIPNPPSGFISLEKLKNYKVLFLLGDVKMDKPLADRLVEYVENGGTLVVNSEQLNDNFSKDFSGAVLGNTLKTGSVSKSVEDNRVIDDGKANFEYREAKLLSAKPLIVDDKGNPLLTVNRYKKGNVILSLQCYMVSDEKDKKALPVVGYILEKINKEQILPVSVEGNIEYILNKNRNGWWLSLINNKGVYKKGLEQEIIKPDEEAKVSVKFKGKVDDISELISGKKIEFTEKDGYTLCNLCIPAGEINILEIKAAK